MKKITREERDRILQVSSSGYNNVDKFNIILNELGIEVEPEPPLIEGLSPVPWEYTVTGNIHKNGVVIGSAINWIDARLMAAAPNLYAAAKSYMIRRNGRGDSITLDNVVQILRAAIAKADGKDGE